MAKNTHYFIISPEDNYEGVIEGYDNTEPYRHGPNILKGYSSEDAANAAYESYKARRNNRRIMKKDGFIHYDVDAFCFTDGSAEQLDGKRDPDHFHASFGIIVIPTNEIDPVIVESGLVYDRDLVNSRRIIRDISGNDVTSDIIFPTKANGGTFKRTPANEASGYAGYGLAETGEAEGAYRVIEICKENEYKNIAVFSDNIAVQGLFEDFYGSNSPAFTRFKECYYNAINSGYSDARGLTEHVHSHSEYNKNGNEYFFAVMNDLADIIAKSLLKKKSCSKFNPITHKDEPISPIEKGELENPNLYNQIEDKSLLGMIYDVNVSSEDSQKAAMTIARSLIPWAKSCVRERTL